MRFRNIFIGIGSIIVTIILLMSDPDSGFIRNLPFGSGTLSFLIILSSSVLYIGLLHVARKGLFDYIDLGVYAKKASQDPIGAAIVFLGVCISMLAIAIVILAAVK